MRRSALALLAAAALAAGIDIGRGAQRAPAAAQRGRTPCAPTDSMSAALWYPYFGNNVHGTGWKPLNSMFEPTAIV